MFAVDVEHARFDGTRMITSLEVPFSIFGERVEISFYKRLREECNRGHVKMTYDRGVLEIMPPTTAIPIGRRLSAPAPNPIAIGRIPAMVEKLAPVFRSQ